MLTCPIAWWSSLEASVSAPILCSQYVTIVTIHRPYYWHLGSLCWAVIGSSGHMPTTGKQQSPRRGFYAGLPGNWRGEYSWIWSFMTLGFFFFFYVWITPLNQLGQMSVKTTDLPLIQQVFWNCYWDLLWCFPLNGHTLKDTCNHRKVFWCWKSFPLLQISLMCIVARVFPWPNSWLNPAIM